jgi:hypothetical protein
MPEVPRPIQCTEEIDGQIVDLLRRQKKVELRVDILNQQAQQLSPQLVTPLELSAQRGVERVGSQDLERASPTALTAGPSLDLDAFLAGIDQKTR